MRRLIILSLAVLSLAAGLVLYLQPRNARPIPVTHAPPDPAAMRAAVSTIRGALATFKSKHGSFPGQLDELVNAGILKTLPDDPVTRSNRTWKPVRESRVRVDDFAAGPATSSEKAAIVDVRSGAEGYDAGGKPWSEY